MEKYPDGIPNHFFREQKPKKDKKKKKKNRYKTLEMEPASVKKQLKIAGPSNVSTRSKRTDSECGMSSNDLTDFNSLDGSFNRNDPPSINLTGED